MPLWQQLCVEVQQFKVGEPGPLMQQVFPAPQQILKAKKTWWQQVSVEPGQQPPGKSEQGTEQVCANA